MEITKEEADIILQSLAFRKNRLNEMLNHRLNEMLDQSVKNNIQKIESLDIKIRNEFGWSD